MYLNKIYLNIICTYDRISYAVSGSHDSVEEAAKAGKF